MMSPNSLISESLSSSNCSLCQRTHPLYMLSNVNRFVFLPITCYSFLHALLVCQIIHQCSLLGSTVIHKQSPNHTITVHIDVEIDITLLKLWRWVTGIIHDSPIEQISSYKYLGVHLDDTSSWHVHVDILCSRLHQRLYFLRRLRVYRMNKSFMVLFYQAVLESLIRYGMSSWYGNLTAKLKTKLARLVHTAMKVIGKSSYQTLQSINQQSVAQARRVVNDPSHILHSEYDLLPSGRRYRVPYCILNCFKN